MVTVSLCQNDLFKLQTETKSLDNRPYPLTRTLAFSLTLNQIF